PPRCRREKRYSSPVGILHFRRRSAASGSDLSETERPEDLQKRGQLRYTPHALRTGRDWPVMSVIRRSGAERADSQRILCHLAGQSAIRRSAKRTHYNSESVFCQIGKGKPF